MSPAPVAVYASSLQAPDEPDERIELGRRVYNFRCYYCHGYSGDAKTLASEMLNPKPRDFTAVDARELSRERMLSSVREGRPGTAMQPFGRTLTEREIEAVVDFVRAEFVLARKENTRYHTAENGWPDHERFKSAYPFATGEIALDADPSALDALQRAGRRLYLASCVSCHDRSRVDDARLFWTPEALSYPRAGFQPGDSDGSFDAISGATPYARHDIPPSLADATPLERAGELLFQDNCAFCHAADGTGRNWIGTFLEPSPRDLTASEFMRSMTRHRLREVIRDGLAGTSMPAWRSVLDARQIEAIVAYVHRVFHPLAD